MKNKYVIQDLTATDNKYIGYNGENVNLVENAKVYDSEQEAKEVISGNRWELWAWVEDITEQEFYFSVYDKEDTYNDGECLTNFDTEEDAIEFVTSENAGYGYEKLYYTINEIDNN